MSEDHISAQELKQRILVQALPLLQGLDAAANVESSSDGMTRLMVQAGLDGLIGIGIDRSDGAYLATCQGEVLTNYYLRVIQDEATARAHLGLEPLPPKPSEIEKIAGGVDQVRERLEQLSVQLEPKTGPLFSVAADAYYEKVRKAKGTKGSKKDGSKK